MYDVPTVPAAAPDLLASEALSVVPAVPAADFAPLEPVVALVSV